MIIYGERLSLAPAQRARRTRSLGDLERRRHVRGHRERRRNRTCMDHGAGQACRGTAQASAGLDGRARAGSLRTGVSSPSVATAPRWCGSYRCLPADGTAPPAAKLVETLAHAGPIVTAALNADNTLLVTGGFDGVATVWDLFTGQPIATFEHADVVTTTNFIPGQTRLATGSRDGTAGCWNTQIAEGALRARLGYPRARGLARRRGRWHRRQPRHAGARRHRDRARRTSRPGVRGRVHGDGRTARQCGRGRCDRVGCRAWRADRGARRTRRADSCGRDRSQDNDTAALLVGTHVELWSLSTRTKVRDLEGGNIEAVATAPRGGMITSRSGLIAAPARTARSCCGAPMVASSIGEPRVRPRTRRSRSRRTVTRS